MAVLMGSVAGSSSGLAGGIIMPAPKMVSDVTPMTVKQRPPAIKLQLGQWRRAVYGLTKNSAGVLLPGCTVDLFDTATDTKRDSCVSDASARYEVSAYLDGPFYIVAYLAGSPDVAGTTVNTLIGF